MFRGAGDELALGMGDRDRGGLERCGGWAVIFRKEKAKLRTMYLELNPVEIRKRMEAKLRELWGLNG